MKQMKIQSIPLDWLEAHPDNPRKDLGDLTELAESIRANGILQNLTVVSSPKDGMFRVVIGHRRMAAAKLAGLKEVPCTLAVMDEKEQVATMLAENMQRSDLTPYEQAWGFRQMSMLGCSVEEISEKSGFSESTVRRRLKMAELDAETLRQVSNDAERQITLADFDRLAEIGDIDLRNQALTEIGTRNFSQEVEKAKVAEAVKANMPALQAWLEAHGCTQISRQDSWTNTYERFYGKNGKYYGFICIDKLGTPGNTLPTDEEIGDRKLYYTLDERNAGFFVVKARAPKEAKDPAQLARERLAREVKKEIKALSALHYGMRKRFVENLSVTKRNREAVLTGAVLIGMSFCIGRSVNHRDEVNELCGLDKYEHGTQNILQGIGKLTDGVHDRELAQAIYAMYKDHEENWFASYMDVGGHAPFWDRREHNTALTLLYNWLMLLGYEPSEDELALMDGSHELYHREKTT